MRYGTSDGKCPEGPTKALIITLSVIRTKGMRRKEETDLVLGDFEVEVGTGELGHDDVHPESAHGRAIGYVRRVSRSSSTSEEESKFSEGADNKGPRVSTPRERTNGGSCGEATFDDEAHRVAIVVLTVGLAYFGGGENGAEREQPILWILKLGLHTITRVHAGHEIARLDFGALEYEQSVSPGTFS